MKIALFYDSDILYQFYEYVNKNLDLSKMWNYVARKVAFTRENRVKKIRVGTFQQPTIICLIPKFSNNLIVCV